MLNRSGCELTLKAWTNFKNFYEQEIKTLFIQGGERVVFNDAAIALDLNGNAGITAKILGAIFRKESLSNKNYVGIGLSFLDTGWTSDNLAGLALDAAGAKT